MFMPFSDLNDFSQQYLFNWNFLIVTDGILISNRLPVQRVSVNSEHQIGWVLNPLQLVEEITCFRD